MPGTTRGTSPGTETLLPLTFADGCRRSRSRQAPTTASSTSARCRGWKAPWKIPRAHESYSLNYGVPTVVAITTAATSKLLAADGWVQFLQPLDEKSSLADFQEGPAGARRCISRKASAGPINRWCTTPPTGSTPTCRSRRMRPTSCSTSTGPISAASRLRAFDATPRFLPQGDGRDRLEAALRRRCCGALAQRQARRDGRRTARAPITAMTTATASTGSAPIMLTLQRRDDGKTSVEIRVAPFALPQTLEADSEMAGLPRPKPTKTAAELRQFRLGPPQDGGRRYRRPSRDACLLSPRTRSRNWNEETKRRRRHAG